MSPARLFTGETLVLATHNQGKVREIAAMLTGYVSHFPSAGDLGLPEPEETGATFAANAALKAKAASAATGLPALADDSGLSVEALDGQPGIYSARWAGPDKNFRAAFARIEEGLRDDPARRAFFTCALCLAWPDGHVEIAEGRVTGTLVLEPRGSGGFGYDPWFVPDGAALTFAEMTNEQKEALSHRRRAFDALIARCFARQQIEAELP